MGNQLRSPTNIGHLSLSDNSTDDYLYVNGVPITGGPSDLNIENYGSTYGLVQKTNSGRENTASGFGVSFGRDNDGKDSYYGILAGFKNVGIGQGADALGGENKVGVKYIPNEGTQTISGHNYVYTFTINNVLYGIEYNAANMLVDTTNYTQAASISNSQFTLNNIVYHILSQDAVSTTEIISGLWYTTDGDDEANVWSLATGEGSVIAARDALSVGYKNVVLNRGCAAIGSRLKTGLSGDLGQLVIGFNNVGKNDTVFEVGNGSDSNHRANAFEVSRTGDAKVIRNLKVNNALIVGLQDQGVVDGAYSASIGSENTNHGVASMTVGDWNVISNNGRGNFVAGTTSNAKGEQSATFGLYNNNNNNYCLVCGHHNDNKSGNLFEIGNGADLNHRSNAFEVTATGIARAYGTPTSSNDLITKGYADSHYGGVQLHQHTITTDLATIVVRSNVSTSFSDFNDVFTYAVGPVRNEYGQTYIAINNELCGCYEYDVETGDINLVSTDMPTIINDVVE